MGYFSSTLKGEDCEGRLRLTLKFLEEYYCPVQAVVEWLYKNGGGCNCEVLDNVEERFVVMKIIPKRESEDKTSTNKELQQL